MKIIYRDKYKLKGDWAREYKYQYEPYPLTESTIGHISKELFLLAKSKIANLRATHPAGANLHMKVLLSDIDNHKGVAASFVLNLDNVSTKKLYEQIEREVMRRSNKHYPTEDYILYVTEVNMFVSGIPTRGGCNAGKTKNLKTSVDANTTVKFINHKSIGNNCLIQCFNEAYGVSGRELKAAKVRAELKLEPGTKIDMKYIPKLSKYYNTMFPDQQKGYVLINQSLKVLLFSHPSGKKVDELIIEDGDDRLNLIQLCLMNEHYYTYEVTSYQKCTGCGEKLLSSNDTHKCDKNRASFYTSKISCSKNMVRSVKIEEDKIDYENIVHWDLETFQPADGGVRHEIYASGFYDHKYKSYYGEDAGRKTIDHFMQMQGRTISAYNGSGFDYTFLLDNLTARGANIENLIMNNGRIMSFTYHTGDEKHRNKIFDLFLFTMCGLDAACQDFKIKNAKTSFDHSKMKSWEDVETHKQEVLPYLKMDVLGLKELFETFNDVIYAIEKTNITRFLTASHMGYNIWQNLNDKIIEVPKDLEKMDFIAKAVYGGRCYPHQRLYKSSMYDDVKAGKLKYADVVNSESRDFIFNADASSLYPASMSGFDHMKVEYPIGYSRWSFEPQIDFDAGKLGFYEVKFNPPKDLRIPILPRRKIFNGSNVGVTWSLEEGSGIYTSVDILNAIEGGYSVSFVGKALVYDQSGDVFSTYIERFYKLKGEAEKEGNDSMRNIAKLLLNSLYGKMLMAPIDNHTEIINNAVELNTFLLKFNLVDYQILNENKVMLVGQVKGERKVEKINKPRQLGAFVTAYSRRIMLFYMKEIDPTLKSLIFTYTDTDSLHISGDAYLNLMAKGLIKTKKDAQLGYLCSDIKNEGVILKEMNLAPKTYLYESIGNQEDIKVTMKCKGIPKKVLQEIDYEQHGRVIEFSGLKKKTTKLTKADVEKGIPLFSVCNNTQTRTFMKNEWGNMTLLDNEYYPHGYNSKG